MAHLPPPSGQAAQPGRPLLPFHQLLTLSIYWLGIQTIWGGLNTIIIPGRLDDMSRETAGTLMAIIFIAGAVAPILIQPTVGVISDYTVTRWGRRKPYIVIGAANPSRKTTSSSAPMTMYGLRRPQRV
ncbi:MAG TPA: MFS transporter, partial [Candidatus Dormibacteraeota bacterium]|nr:MFS transporter [Candidatus Dormibacteraeota bacterium]